MTNNIELKGLYFTIDEMHGAREKNGLLRIGIAIGDGGKKRRCDSHCPYCFEGQESEVDGFSADEVSSIIKEAKELGAKTIVVIGYGEPLLNPRLDETYAVLEIIKQMQLTPVLFTNGLSVTDEKAERLSRLDASVITKLNSHNSIIQDYLTRRKGSLGRMQESLKNLMGAGLNETQPTRLGLETIITADNLGDLPNLAKFCVENNIYPYFESLKFVGQLAKNPHLYVNGNHIQTAFESILELYPKIFGTDGEAYVPQGRCCLQHYYGSLYVTPEGIFPCSGVGYKVGDVREGETLKQALTHPLIQKLRDLPDHIEGKCKSCPNIIEEKGDIPKCYGGCRGNAYSFTGNPFAEDPLCWRNSSQPNQ